MWLSFELLIKHIAHMLYHFKHLRDLVEQKVQLFVSTLYGMEVSTLYGMETLYNLLPCWPHDVSVFTVSNIIIC